MHASFLRRDSGNERKNLWLPLPSRLFCDGRWTSAGRTAAASIAAREIRNSRQRYLRHRHGIAYIRLRGIIMRRHFTRAQKMVIVQGILFLVLVIDIIQLYVITATMNSYLGGDAGVPAP